MESQKQILSRALNETHQLLFQMFGMSVMAYEPGSEITTLLANAAADLRDAAQLDKHPLLKRMDCTLIDGKMHVPSDGPLLAICGAAVPIEESMLMSKRVPTCERCVELLEAQTAKPQRVREIGTSLGGGGVSISPPDGQYGSGIGPILLNVRYKDDQEGQGDG